jgi:diguanylate cyclase (GGDEF)-like protein/PAS domain S-box-containing protein
MTRSTPTPPLSHAAEGASAATPTLNPEIFRRLTDTSSQAIGMAGLNNRILYANHTFQRLLGIPDEARLADHSFYDFYCQQDSRRLREEIMPRVQNHGEWSGEISLCSLTGAEYQTIQNIFLIRDDSGAPAAFANVITDISERVNADTALRIKDAAIASSINAIAIAGLDGKISYVNQALVDLWRLPGPKQALGRSPLEFWDDPEAAKTVAEALYSEGRWQGELCARLHDGALADMQLSAHMVLDGDGKPLCMMSSFIDITARKQIEQALRQERDFATSLINTAPVIILLLDTQGMIQHANPYFETFSGYRLDEIKGKEWFAAFIPPRDQARIRALFHRAKHDEPTRGNTNPIVIRSGEEREIEWNAQPIRDAQGAVTALLAIGLDVTARKALEHTIHSSAERLNEAQHLARVGSWELDLISGELNWSDEVFRILEMDKAQFDGTYAAFLDAIHPDDREAVHQAYTVSLVTRAPYEINHRLLMSDGRIKWVQERCSSDFDRDGKPLRSRGTVQDISERIHAEQALAQSAALFRTLAQVAPVGIFRTDVAGQFTYVNEYYCDIIGRSSAAALGSGWSNAIHPNDRTRVAEAWEEAVKKQTPCSSEYRILRPDGQEIWVVGRVRAEQNIQGEVIGYVGTLADITQRKSAEEEIRRLAFYDQLTGLPNRRLLLDRLQQALAASARSGHHGALLFIDLDNFKQLNDTLGHDHGDLLLQQVAQHLASSVRAIDTVARFGGDEFVVMLEDLSTTLAEAATQTEAVAEKIHAALNHPCQLGDHIHHATPSIGATLFSGHQHTMEELLRQADLAMYSAKSAGRNALRFFNSAAI